MRLDFVNPASLIPTQNTESGAPVGAQHHPIPLENVIPAFSLPDQGSRTEDKEEENQQQAGSAREGEETAANEQQPLPEIFSVVMPPDFRELFQLFYSLEENQFVLMKRRFRIRNDVHSLKPYSGWYLDEEQSSGQRENSYKETLFYHYTRPGNRFKGAM